MRLRYSEITPETLYLSRRELLAGAGAAALAVAAGTGEPARRGAAGPRAPEGHAQPGLSRRRCAHQDGRRHHLQQLLRVRDQQGRSRANWPAACKPRPWT